MVKKTSKESLGLDELSRKRETNKHREQRHIIHEEPGVTPLLESGIEQGWVKQDRKSTASVYLLWISLEGSQASETRYLAGKLAEQSRYRTRSLPQ